MRIKFNEDIWRLCPAYCVSYTRSRPGFFSYSCSFSGLRVPDCPHVHLKL